MYICTASSIHGSIMNTISFTVLIYVVMTAIPMGLFVMPSPSIAISIPAAFGIEIFLLLITGVIIFILFKFHLLKMDLTDTESLSEALMDKNTHRQDFLDELYEFASSSKGIN